MQLVILIFSRVVLVQFIRPLGPHWISASAGHQIYRVGVGAYTSDYGILFLCMNRDLSWLRLERSLSEVLGT